MQGIIRSTFAGVASGIATFFASVPALGYTNAIVMPSWAPLRAWEIIVVFGLGATAVALVMHFAAIWLLRARGPLALAAFLGTTLAALALADLINHGTKALASWLIGALLATLACRILRPNNSFKPTLLRKAA